MQRKKRYRKVLYLKAHSAKTTRIQRRASLPGGGGGGMLLMVENWKKRGSGKQGRQAGIRSVEGCAVPEKGTD